MLRSAPAPARRVQPAQLQADVTTATMLVTMVDALETAQAPLQHVYFSQGIKYYVRAPALWCQGLGLQASGRCCSMCTSARASSTMCAQPHSGVREKGYRLQADAAACVLQPGHPGLRARHPSLGFII